MKLTVLGYMGGFPSKDGASSTYLIEKDDYTLLIDLGSGGLLTYQKYKTVTELDAVLVSHYHADHIADIGVLQHALLVNSFLTDSQKVVPIYGHMENREAFQKLNHKYTKATVYKEQEALKIGPFFIRFLKTKHPVPCYGMRITDGNSTIVYTADSAYQDAWISFSRNADLLIADTSLYHGQNGNNTGHMTSTEVGEIAKQANVREVILSHLPHYGDHHQLVKETEEIFQGKVKLAFGGYTWEK